MRLAEDKKLMVLSALSILVALLVIFSAFCDAKINADRQALQEKYAQLQVDLGSLIESRSKVQLFTILMALNPSTISLLPNTLGSLRDSEEKRIVDEYEQGKITTHQYISYQNERWNKEVDHFYVKYRKTLAQLDSLRKKVSPWPLLKTISTSLQIALLITLAFGYAYLFREINERVTRKPKTEQGVQEMTS